MILLYSASYQLLASPLESTVSPIEILFDFSGELILIKSRSQTAKHTWIQAGYLLEKIVVEGELYTGESHKLSLKEGKIIKLSPIPLRLFYYPKYWLNDITLEVYSLND